MKANVSFNLGVRYVNIVRQLRDDNYAVADVRQKVTYSMMSFPLTVQYNFTRGIIQPFIYGGMSYLKNNITSTDLNPANLGDTYYKSWNISADIGAGVEISITNFLQARVEWRYDDFSQYPTAGLSLRF